MCDYSLQYVKSRPAAVGDKLVTRSFGTGTTGFAEQGAAEPIAICVLPGTEIAFDDPVAIDDAIVAGQFKQTQHKLARFRQINKDTPRMHHDALELPDGEVVLLTSVQLNQCATVLQLPALPKSEAEAKDQQRLEVVG